MKKNLIRICSVAFVTLYLSANVMSCRIIHVGGISLFDAGTLVFPLTYFLGEFITEVWGKKIARQTAWMTLGCQLLFTGLIWVATKIPYPAESAALATAYEQVFTFVPRITLASVVAFITGELTNIHIMAFFKERIGGALWMRTITSSVVGYSLDAFIFIMIAFSGVLPMRQLFTMMAIQVAFSILVEVCISTPLTYLATSWVRKKNYF